MKFKIWSDLHLEFYNSSNINKIIRILSRYFPEQEDDKNTILLISGDIGTYIKWDLTYKIVFETFSKRFKKVIAVPGNHSWYESDIWNNETDFLKDKNIPENVFYGDNFFVDLDKNTRIIGSCLWTDMDKENPLFLKYIERMMNDYNLIREKSSSEYKRDKFGSYEYKNSKPIKSFQTLERFKKSKEFIISTLEDANKNNIKNKIILTHHAPTFYSVDSRYRDNKSNPAYCSNLEDIMFDYDVTLWVHGHIHGSNDYMVGNTRVVSNPFGYHNYDVNPEFNSNLIIDI